MDEKLKNVEIVNELIASRRSIYPQVYTDQEVEEEVVEKILENASWAPSHRQTRPWHFVVFSGEGKKKLADYQASFYKENTPADQFEQKKYDKLLSKPLKSSHVIAICMKRDLKHSVPEIEEIEAVACAVQNMHLTATSYSVGAYWGTGGVTYEEDAKPFFDLGKEDKLLGFFFLGYPKIDWPKGIARDWKEHVSWVKS